VVSADVLENLLHITRRMAETRTLDSLLDYAMGQVLEFVGAETGYLILVNHDGALDFRVKRSRSGQDIEKPGEQISRTIFDRVIARRESVILADALVAPDFQSSKSVQGLRLRSVMCAPLTSRGGTLGAIYVENRAEHGIFDAGDLQSLEFFASQAAVCIENAMLNDGLEAQVAARTIELVQVNEQLRQEIEMRKLAEARLHQLAITDPLTNIYNRRQFFLLADRELERARRGARGPAVILFDLDHFKQINDRYGHLVGDQVLQSFARCCSDTLRERDILARYGGEEFAILLPDTDAEQARQAAERLRQVVEEAAFDTDKGPMRITSSFGVVAFSTEPGLTVDRLLDRADQALFLSKGEGRNRVSVWSAPVGDE